MGVVVRSQGPENIVDFECPPVIETVLGVEFQPLPGWGVPFFGVFWDHIRAEYPKTQIQPPLPSQIEVFKRSPPRAVSVELAPGHARCWYTDKTDTALIQVQRDRFIANWRRGDGDRRYPRYRNTRPRFEREWVRFRNFLAKHDLGVPEVLQCEVTYINHIEKGSLWRSWSELSRVATCWSGLASAEFLPAPDAVAFDTSFSMPDQRGRLHIKLQRAIRHADQKEILHLSLTARGRPSSSEVPDVLAWMDLGREWVVRGFLDFTSEEMHEVWRRE